MIAFVIGFVVAIAILASLAPHDHNQSVSTSTVPASVCGLDGPPASVTLVNDTGPNIYRVVCGDGVVEQWGQ